MATRLKNLKPKKHKENEDKFKCCSCKYYYFEPYYNECLKKSDLDCFDIEKQKFCKKYEDFRKRKRKKYSLNDDIPF